MTFNHPPRLWRQRHAKGLRLVEVLVLGGSASQALWCCWSRLNMRSTSWDPRPTKPGIKSAATAGIPTSKLEKIHGQSMWKACASSWQDHMHNGPSTLQTLRHAPRQKCSFQGADRASTMHTGMDSISAQPCTAPCGAPSELVPFSRSARYRLAALTASCTASRARGVSRLSLSAASAFCWAARRASRRPNS